MQLGNTLIHDYKDGIEQEVNTTSLSETSG